MTARSKSSLSAPSGSDLDEGVAALCARVEADAVSALRYIEKHYGRLGGVGWDRVFNAHDELYRRGAPLSTPSSTLTPDAASGLSWEEFRAYDLWADEAEHAVMDPKKRESLRLLLAAVDRLAELPATPAIRNRAFEEAARVARQHHPDERSRQYIEGRQDAARAIRALKGTPFASQSGNGLRRAQSHPAYQTGEAGATANLPNVPSPDLLKELVEALRQLASNAEIAKTYLPNTEEADIVSSALFDTLSQARAALLKAQQPVKPRERDGHTFPATDPPDFQYPGPHDDLGPIIGGSE